MPSVVGTNQIVLILMDGCAAAEATAPPLHLLLLLLVQLLASDSTVVSIL